MSAAEDESLAESGDDLLVEDLPEGLINDLANSPDHPAAKKPCTDPGAGPVNFNSPSTSSDSALAQPARSPVLLAAAATPTSPLQSPAPSLAATAAAPNAPVLCAAAYAAVASSANPVPALPASLFASPAPGGSPRKLRRTRTPATTPMLLPLRRRVVVTLLLPEAGLESHRMEILAGINLQLCGFMFDSGVIPPFEHTVGESLRVARRVYGRLLFSWPSQQDVAAFRKLFPLMLKISNSRPVMLKVYVDRFEAFTAAKAAGAPTLSIRNVPLKFDPEDIRASLLGTTEEDGAHWLVDLTDFHCVSDPYEETFFTRLAGLPVATPDDPNFERIPTEILLETNKPAMLLTPALTPRCPSLPKSPPSPLPCCFPPPCPSSPCLHPRHPPLPHSASFPGPPCRGAPSHSPALPTPPLPPCPLQPLSTKFPPRERSPCHQPSAPPLIPHSLPLPTSTPPSALAPPCRWHFLTEPLSLSPPNTPPTLGAFPPRVSPEDGPAAHPHAGMETLPSPSLSPPFQTAPSPASPTPRLLPSPSSLPIPLLSFPPTLNPAFPTPPHSFHPPPSQGPNCNRPQRSDRAARPPTRLPPSASSPLPPVSPTLLSSKPLHPPLVSSPPPPGLPNTPAPSPRLPPPPCTPLPPLSFSPHGPPPLGPHPHLPHLPHRSNSPCPPYSCTSVHPLAPPSPPPPPPNTHPIQSPLPPPPTPQPQCSPPTPALTPRCPSLPKSPPSPLPCCFPPRTAAWVPANPTSYLPLPTPLAPPIPSPAPGAPPHPAFTPVTHLFPTALPSPAPHVVGLLVTLPPSPHHPSLPALSNPCRQTSLPGLAALATNVPSSVPPTVGPPPTLMYPPNSHTPHAISVSRSLCSTLDPPLPAPTHFNPSPHNTPPPSPSEDGPPTSHELTLHPQPPPDLQPPRRLHFRSPQRTAPLPTPTLAWRCSPPPFSPPRFKQHPPLLPPHSDSSPPLPLSRSPSSRFPLPSIPPSPPPLSLFTPHPLKDPTATVPSALTGPPDPQRGSPSLPATPSPRSLPHSSQASRSTPLWSLLPPRLGSRTPPPLPRAFPPSLHPPPPATI
ncbi:unnamed protein product [Closterium sp. Naga37s-1]|nr:unnamed protein product [Closterium sp. Naga37s-1]